MAIAFVGLVKLAMIVVGLALFSSGCASMHPSTSAPSAALAPVDKKTPVVQQQQPDIQQVNASQQNPIVASIYIASGLAQLGNFLVGGK
jgi:PBP1b-binding outer membrane lipoprotein LpoB